MALRRGARDRQIDIWPGFVDALSSLLMAVLFLVMLFVLGQFLLNDAISGRDARLAKLNEEITQLGQMLSLERGRNQELRSTVGRLSNELQVVTTARDELSRQLSAVTAQAEDSAAVVERLRGDLAKANESLQVSQKKVDDLAAQVVALQRMRDELESDLAAAREAGKKAEAATAEQAARAEKLAEEVAKGLEALKAATAQRQQDQQRIAADEASITQLKSQNEQLAKSLAETQQQAKAQTDAAASQAAQLQSDLANRLAELGRLKGLVDALTAARKELEDKLAAERQRTAELGKQLGTQQDLTRASKTDVDRLTNDVATLRQEIARLSTALDVSKKDVAERDVRIADLGQRLNAALLNKVEELKSYRSEFFGALRQVIGDRPDIRVVGDRFVLPTEVLFPSGSAELEPQGQTALAKVADTLKAVAAKIPARISWVLRVDGHTDSVPIRTQQFPSNWELSSARALAVVHYLVQQGIPPERLVAAGFGEYQPLDPTPNSEIANRRNRRIEFKLTER